MNDSINAVIGYPEMGCQVSARGQGLAVRGIFVLLLVPVGIYVLWKRRRK